MALGSNTSGHLFDTTFTTAGLLYSAASGVVTSTAAGTAGQVMTSNGPGVPPTYQAAAGGSSTYFSAYLSATTGSVTGDGTLYGPVVFNTATSNSGAYATGTGIFTAPTTGGYSFNMSIAFVGGDVLTTGYLAVFSGSAYSSRAFQLQEVAIASNVVIASASIMIPMTAGDTMSVFVDSGGTNKNVTIFGATPAAGATVTSVFSGFRVY